MVFANRPPNYIKEEIITASPDETFRVAEKLGARLLPGDVVLLMGTLGAGKTLFTKGILQAVGFDIDEVTSPSFTLVNLYRAARVDVYHIDLWRLDARGNPAFEVGLDDIFAAENVVVIIEWAERLGDYHFPSRVFSVEIDGNGDEPRKILIGEYAAANQI